MLEQKVLSEQKLQHAEKSLKTQQFFS